MKQKAEKLGNEEKVSLMFDLVNSFKDLRNASEIADFLEDLLTANEIKILSIRLRIAKLLLSGKHQREVVRETHSSLGTVNKVNIWLEKGGNGFKKAIAKLPLKWGKPTKIPHGPIEFHLPELLLATGQYAVAEKQDKTPKELIEKMSEKEVIDKEIAEMNSELYRK
ncbi:MAG: TrpR-like protein [Microgenomates group bacterium GW2011_GWC1_39_7b]|uniref:TrpR like protein, YerC/YecD n=2 Tax=Candidatus Woeseibacteriota TaxID=1752722 RepID=A0A0G0UY50_9BACT|nr:MAG: TrpR like protein, YerC/YecD [Candidatus Woesebacteria bacterium GW2011_GWB1_39_10]KKR26137.1 MAG: TrpR-like protein [Microgenomates group bacterium GW2011_GWC1_39_7b]KKR92446.1 MAG: TrpR like protein, YerC/YecD [Candidatus Woesebacteria bacterium GW2011_GWA1_41_13b]